MAESLPMMAEQIARAANDFERQRTGHLPQSVTVVMSSDTLVITMHGSLSPGEKVLAQSPEGAAKVQEFHRQLFATSWEKLQQKIKEITGVEVRAAKAEIETSTGAIVQVFATGTMVQVYLLAGKVRTDSWSDADPDGVRPKA